MRGKYSSVHSARQARFANKGDPGTQVTGSPTVSQGIQKGSGVSREFFARTAQTALQDDAVESGNFFRLVPDELNRLADHRADGVIRVVVAIRAGKLHHAEFHAGILALAGEPHGVWVCKPAN
jgi:hypothetical protein